VEEWENLGGVNVLKNYYDDPKRWAFTFQLNAIHSRNMLWKQITSEQPDRLHYSERSPLADRYVFGEIMYREGNLDAAEYEIYSEVCGAVIRECPLKAIIYLKCSPELCLERIRQRGRKGEEGISLEYLRKVHERHEEWLLGIHSIPVITIDTGVYDVYNQTHQDEIAQMIKAFIDKVGREERSQVVEGEEEVKVTA
jgi:deoxyadenosine/deoxycytidine kinase